MTPTDRYLASLWRCYDVAQRGRQKVLRGLFVKLILRALGFPVELP